MGSVGIVARAGAVAVAAALLLGAGAVGPADASPTAKKKCAKPAGLASGVSWDHTDPLYMQVIGATTWQNCRGAIRKVVLEMRMMNPQGGLTDGWTQTLTPDLVHKANGQQTYSYAQGLDDARMFEGQGYMQACGKRTSGYSTTALTGYTWYTIAKAYDRNGKMILQTISPSVVCDQNG
jgi:hypothetical protein